MALLLLAPALTVIGVFGFAPLLTGFYMSLFDWRFGASVFVRFAHYARALTSPDFWRSFMVTIYYVIGTIPTTMLLSFFIAYALHRIVVARGLFRTVYFLPYVASTVAAAMVWRTFFNSPEGVANLLLHYLGIPPQKWLIEPRGLLHLITGGLAPMDFGPTLPLCCVILFDIWHGSGFMIVVFLAGLTAIPRELEEAAWLDGAGALRVIRSVVLPLLSPTILFLGVVSTIKAFQAFNSFYALTQDPDKALFRPTANVLLFMYDQLYNQNNIGYGAAVATLFTVAIVLVTALQWRLVGRRVHYA